MDDFVCSSPVNPVAAALLGLGGSISREHRGKPKRILIEPKSMSARHHLALSVEHRTTPLTLSIAPPSPNTIQTIAPFHMASAPFGLPPPGWSLGSKRGRRTRAVPRLRNHRCHSINSAGRALDLSVNTLQLVLQDRIAVRDCTCTCTSMKELQPS